MDEVARDRRTRRSFASPHRTDGEARPVAHALAGVLGASMSTSLFYPLDALRTQMHVCKGGDIGQLSSLRHIVQQKGLRGLYAGFAVTVTSYGIGWGTYMAVFKSVQQYLTVYVAARSTVGDGVGGETNGMVVACNLASGVAAAVATGTIVTPFCLVKTRQQLHDGNVSGRPYNCWQGLKSIVANEGCRALMRGAVPQILITGNTIIQMAIYEDLKHRIVEKNFQPSSLDVALMSSFSKAVASALFNPFEVVRTRLQDMRNCSSAEYSSMGVGLRTIWTTEGLRGLYRGVWVNLCRVIPTTSVSFILYEKFLTYFSNYDPREMDCLPTSVD